MSNPSGASYYFSRLKFHQNTFHLDKLAKKFKWTFVKRFS